MKWDPTNTSVAEVHFIICEQAVDIANQKINDTKIANKWKGTPIQNNSQYAGDGLSLIVAPEYQSCPPRVREIYTTNATQALRQAIANNQEKFVGMVFGEAKAGRNYFDRWQQAPVHLF